MVHDTDFNMVKAELLNWIFEEHAGNICAIIDSSKEDTHTRTQLPNVIWHVLR